MSEKLKVDTRITVETPEGVDFEFRLAGPGKRGIAFLVDWLIKAAVIFAVLQVVSFATALSMETGGVALGFLLLVLFAINWLYSGLFEAFWNGQTPGKRSQHLRVVRGNGTPIGFYEAFGRNLLLAADAVPGVYTVGLISMLCTRRMQRLGDWILDTMVIDESREPAPRLEPSLSAVEAIPRSDCTGTYGVPDRTLSIIERLFDQNRVISMPRREEIAQVLAQQLRLRLGYIEQAHYVHEIPTTAEYRNTLFLRRILRTFGQQDSEASEKGWKAGDQIPIATLLPTAIPPVIVTPGGADES